MQITTRDFLKKLGLGGAAVATGAAFADEWVPTPGQPLPPGSCGDPENAWFGKNIFPLPHTQADGPSCFMKDGKVYEPAHELPVFHETDVVVVGGGPAGFAAAVAAAKTGAKVALVERYGSLGGLFTNGMVLIVLATSRKESGGSYSLVTRGVCEEFMLRTATYGKNFCNPPESSIPARIWHPTIDPECAKFVMDQMIAENKVEMFFHSWGVDVIQDGNKVLGVVFESKQGRQAILAKQVVDCTGDADMLFKAGGDYRQVTTPISTVFRWSGLTSINPPKGEKPAYITRGNEGNPDACWSGMSHMRGNGVGIRDLSRIEIAQRAENWKLMQKMRATPGWENVYTSNSASQLGVRQSRLVDCELVLDRKAVKAGPNPADCVCWFGKDGPHEAWPVAYRQIVPTKVDNLLVAGRCIGTGDTIDTCRLIAPCFVTGEAAGTAAALAAAKGIAPRALDVTLLQKTLRAHGAYVG